MNQLPAVAEVRQDLKLRRGADDLSTSEKEGDMITMNLNQDVILCLCQLHHSQKSRSSLGQILGDLEQNIVLAPTGALLYRSCAALCT